MKNKIMIPILFLILASFSYAVTLKDFIYSNYSSPSTANIGGTKYFFGGNYELRFKKNTYAFKPWFNGSPPRFHIGCNGISISGGFISLLGLNDIKNQLDHASTEFAWGLIIGLKSSLPLVSDVFETLQKWARTIQKILQNACQMGQALTKHLIKDDGPQKLNNFFSESAGDEGFSKQKSILNSLNEKADFISHQVDKFIQSADGRGKANAASLLSGKVKGKTISLATFYFGKYLPDISDKKRVAYTGTLYDLYHKKIGDLSLNVDNYNEFNRAVLFHKLTMLLFGELGITKESFKTITKFIDADGKINADKLKNGLLKVLTGMSTDGGVSVIVISSEIDPSNAYKFLMEGASAISNTTKICDSDGTCKVRNLNLIYINSPTDSSVNAATTTTNNKDKDILKVFTLASSENNSSTITLQWKGFYKESLDAIRNLVKKEAGLNSYSFVGTAPSTTTNDNVFILKGMGKYIRILGLLAKKMGGETDYIYYLEQLLAKRNAQTQTFLLVNNLAGYIESLMKDPNVQLGKDAKTALREYFNVVDKARQTIYNNIQGSLKVDDNIRKLDEMFDQIYKSIKQENLKNVGF